MELNKIFLSGLTFLWVCSGNGYSADRQDGKFEPKLFQVTTAETRPNDAVLPKYVDGPDYGGTFQMNPGKVYLTDAEYKELIEAVKKEL